MSDMQSNPGPGLYGNESKSEATSKAPGLMEQFVGVFAEPGQLFTKLNETPAWGWALGASILSALVVAVVWGLKVDVDAMLRPILEANPQVSSDQIDKIIEIQGRFMLPIAVLQTLIIVPIACAFMALIYWLIGKGTAEEGKPSYLQAFTVAAVPSLVMVPHSLLTTLMCFLKPVGGSTPEKLAPTSLGYYLAVANPKLQALLFSLDVFTIGYFFVLYIAARRTMRLKPLGAGLCTAVVVLFMVGFKVAFAK